MDFLSTPTLFTSSASTGRAPTDPCPHTRHRETLTDLLGAGANSAMRIPLGHPRSLPVSWAQVQFPLLIPAPCGFPPLTAAREGSTRWTAIPMWETQIKFLSPGFSLAQPSCFQHLGSGRAGGDLSLSPFLFLPLCVCVSLSLFFFYVNRVKNKDHMG